jgi:ABC-2 type transport system ATP-binding protein
VKYRGNFNEVNKILGQKIKVLEHSDSLKENRLKVQFLDGNSNNQLIQTLLPVAEIVSFEEIIPGMNDVFIAAVEESNKGK